MDYNQYQFYRANPFANNDFIPTSSMVNRVPKKFAAQIPQGDEQIPSKPGKRIYRDKHLENQIEKDGLLLSPEKYPYENRIALNKQYRRNLDTIDIEGASSGTKVNESIRNKHKAQEELKRKRGDSNSNEKNGANQSVPEKNKFIGESLDEVYEQKRRQLAEKFQRDIEMRKTKESLGGTGKEQANTKKNQANNIIAEASSNPHNRNPSPSSQLDKDYKDYVSYNSNQKYQSTMLNTPNIGNDFLGHHQRYKRPERTLQTIDHYNHNRLPERIERGGELPLLNFSSSQGMSNSHQNDHTSSNNQETVTTVAQRKPSNTQSPLSSSLININNRYRSNPEYIDNYQNGEYAKRKDEIEKTMELDSTIRNYYQKDKKQFRRHNPTNLSFSIAGKSSLSPIV